MMGEFNPLDPSSFGQTTAYDKMTPVMNREQRLKIKFWTGTVKCQVQPPSPPQNQFSQQQVISSHYIFLYLVINCWNPSSLWEL